jgi:hypothetical protein
MVAHKIGQHLSQSINLACEENMIGQQSKIDNLVKRELGIYGKLER